jgi:hypothetical protein
VTTSYVRTTATVHAVGCINLKTARHVIPMEWAEGLTIWEIEDFYRQTDPPYKSLPGYCSVCLPNAGGIRTWVAAAGPV